MFYYYPAPVIQKQNYQKLRDDLYLDILDKTVGPTMSRIEKVLYTMHIDGSLLIYKLQLLMETGQLDPKINVAQLNYELTNIFALVPRENLLLDGNHLQFFATTAKLLDESHLVNICLMNGVARTTDSKFGYKYLYIPEVSIQEAVVIHEKTIEVVDFEKDKQKQVEQQELSSKITAEFHTTLYLEEEEELPRPKELTPVQKAVATLDLRDYFAINNLIRELPDLNIMCLV